jgi:hypothetical protein
MAHCCTDTPHQHVVRRADSCQSTTLQFDGPLYQLLVSLLVFLLRLSEFSTRVSDKNNLSFAPGCFVLFPQLLNSSVL